MKTATWIMAICSIITVIISIIALITANKALQINKKEGVILELEDVQMTGFNTGFNIEK